jgi:hypothetical protein
MEGRGGGEAQGVADRPPPRPPPKKSSLCMYYSFFIEFKNANRWIDRAMITLGERSLIVTGSQMTDQFFGKKFVYLNSLTWQP